MEKENKYKVDNWNLEYPKLGKDEFMTAWGAFILLLVWMITFFTPLFVFILFVNFIGGL